MKSVYYYLSVLIIFLSACHTNKSELETIKVAQFGDVFIYIPLYLANTKGFFKEEGLKVDLINTGGDDKTYAAVIGGSALFGIADPTFVAIAKEQGIEVHEIAMMMSIALRFIPILLEETDKIMKAQIARGADCDRKYCQQCSLLGSDKKSQCSSDYECRDVSSLQRSYLLCSFYSIYSSN